MVDSVAGSSRPIGKSAIKRLATFFAAILLLVCLAYFGAAWYLKSTSKRTALKAERHLAAGKAVAARQAIKWLMWFHPNDPRGLLTLGRIELADGSVDEAIRCFRRVSLQTPDSAQASLALAQVLAMDGQLTKAEEQLQRHIQQFVPSEEAWNLYFRLLYLQFRTRDVVALLEKKLAANPDDLSDLRYLLKAEFVPQDPLETQPILLEIHKKHSTDANVRTALAICYSRAGETAKAEQLLRSVLQRHPGELRARLFLARLLIDDHQFTAAKKILWGNADISSAAAGREPLTRDDRFWHLSSRLADAHSDIDEALHCMERAIEIRGHEKSYLSGRAQLLRRLSRKDDAAAATELLIEVGRAKQELYLMASQIEQRQISMATCRNIAALYRRLDSEDRADAWNRWGDQFNRMPNRLPQHQRPIDPNNF